MYRRRNQVERLFRRLKGFRRISSRFDKLDIMFLNRSTKRMAQLRRALPLQLVQFSSDGRLLIDGR